jgi:Islet cell autoantigen ICA69, C-terminal domain
LEKFILFTQFCHSNFHNFQIDLLAAARCNLFSYSLASYQTNWQQLNQKNEEVLEAHIKVIEKEPRTHKFGILKELAQEVEDIKGDEAEPVKMDVNDKDQRLFFGDEFSDDARPQPAASKSEESEKSESNLIDYEKDFDEFMASSNILLPSQLLMDDSLFGNEASIDLLGSLEPSHTNQSCRNSSCDLLSAGKDSPAQLNKNPSKKASDVSKWFNLFSELDPLNQQFEQDDASKNLHAA